MRRTVRLTGLFVSILSLSLASAACGGGGGGGGGGGTPNILTFQPDVLYSHEDGAVRILGSGLGSWQDRATIRLTAESGTPFDGGTSDTYEFEGVVDSAQQMRAMLPATLVDVPVNAYVTVVTATGAEYTSETPIAFLQPQRITAITPSVTEGTDPSGIAAPISFELSGEGFQPVGSGVTVIFDDPGPGAFLNGTARQVRASGLIENATKIVGTFPVTQVDATIVANVQVVLQSGETISSVSPLVTFEPTTSFVSITPDEVYDTTTPPFTIVGTKLIPGPATITFSAKLGTPFNGGTSATVTTTGTVNSDTEITGLMPDAGGILFPVEASILIDMGGTLIGSASNPVVTFFPPPEISSMDPAAFDSGNPSPFRTTGPASNFNVVGENLPVGSDAIVTFTADGGASPFNDGTSPTVQITGTVVDTETVEVTNMPDVLLDSTMNAGDSITAAVNVFFVSIGTNATLPAGTATFTQRSVAFVPPSYTTGSSWFNGFSSSIGPGMMYWAGYASAFYSENYNFPAAFSFPYYGTNMVAIQMNAHGFGDLKSSTLSGSFITNNSAVDNPSTSVLSGKDRLAISWTPHFGAYYYAYYSPTTTVYYHCPFVQYDSGTGSMYFSQLTWARTNTTSTSTSSAYRIGSQSIAHQLRIYNTGRIDMIFPFNNTVTGTRLTGISNSSGTSSHATDYSDYVYGVDFDNADSGKYIYEMFTGSGDIESADWVVFHPDGLGGMDFGKGNL